MKELLICLRQVQKIRQVASGEALPYVARSRIGRLITVLNAMAGQLEGHHAKVLVHHCKQVQAIAKTICQPSEPLDNRWRAGWSELLRELDELDLALRATPNA
jgi:hypothetical protein